MPLISLMRELKWQNLSLISLARKENGQLQSGLGVQKFTRVWNLLPKLCNKFLITTLLVWRQREDHCNLVKARHVLGAIPLSSTLWLQIVAGKIMLFVMLFTMGSLKILKITWLHYIFSLI